MEEIKTNRQINNEKKTLDKIKNLGFVNANTIIGDLKIKSRITIECIKGHLLETTVGNLLKRVECVRCESLTRYYEAVAILESYNFTILSKEEDYTGVKDNCFHYLCEKGHEQKHNHNYIMRGHKCSHCFRYGSFYSVVEELTGEGYVVHTTVEDIATTKDKIYYTCPRGHEYYTTVNDMQQGARCGKCQRYKLREIKRTHLDDVLKMFASNNYRIIKNPETYKNGSSVFSVECPNQHKYDTTVANFRSGYRCKRCAYNNNTGESNKGWKGGITPLHNRMREKIAPWKIDSMNNGKYKCFISESKGNMIIHHVKNFSDILEETLSSLNYEVKEKTNEYSDYELGQIEKLCLQKHYDYGLGIIMTENLHMLFHQIYGKKNNTMEQVIEFKKNYLDGKYQELNL